MLYRYDEKREAELAIKNGMSKYLDNEKRLELLNVNKNIEHNTNLLTKFELLLPKLLYKERFGRIDYALAYVNHQHIHAIIKKPFIPLKRLIHIWQQTSGEQNIMIKTIFANSDNYNRVANYLLIQPEKHETYDVTWHFSEMWGHIESVKKESKPQTLKQKIKFIYNPEYQSIEESEKQKQQIIKQYQEQLNKSKIL